MVLLDRRGADRLFASLLGGALAKRRDRDVLSRHRRSIDHDPIARINLAQRREEIHAADLHPTPDPYGRACFELARATSCT